MIDAFLTKLLYTLSIFTIATLASIVVDTHPRLSTILRVVGFLGIPVVFLVTGLIELQDYQLLLVLVTGIVAIGISLHSEGYYKVIYGLTRYFQVAINLILASLILLFSSTLFAELIVYWFFIDIIVAFVAITMEYGVENLSVAATYVAMCVAPSDIALLTMWATLVGKVGLYESLLLPLNEPVAEPVNLDPLLSTIVLFGFAVKLGQFPLHSWPPVVYGRAPSHISAILSGLVSKMGVYAYFTASQLLVINPVAFYFILVQGIISTIYGSFGAVLQSNIKLILAYSSVSYGGILTVLYATMMILGSALLRALMLVVVVFHALTKALAFINAGLIYQLTNTYDLSKLGHLFYVSKEACFSAFTVLLNFTGVPPSIGFVTKVLLIATSVLIARENMLGLIVAVTFTLAAVLSIIYGAKYIGAYISTLPKAPPRIIPIPDIEVKAENYLSAALLLAPVVLIAYISGFSHGYLLGAVMMPAYIATLITYIYAFTRVYSKIRIPEDVKYWLSGVES
ncbi:MAG: proton-conducting transporter membrane subunit [Desulfurococcaceae archaeon]